MEPKKRIVNKKEVDIEALNKAMETLEESGMKIISITTREQADMVL